MKKIFLSIREHSQVVVYDWSDPVDTDEVVEDLEGLNFDYYGAYESQQADWRLVNETEATLERLR